MSYEIQKHKHYFLITFTNTFDKNAVISAFGDLIQDDAFEKETHTIWDMSKATSELSYIDINEIAGYVTASSDHRSSNARAAHVVVDPIDKPIFQSYITATAHYPVEFRMFDDLELAKAWVLD